ncbi:MAG TPA: hypothetical protein VGE31_00075 [Candidatus Paceibacterota bacterium]
MTASDQGTVRELFPNRTVNLGECPDLKHGAVLRHVYPKEAPIWQGHLAELRLMPIPTSRIRDCIFAFTDEPLANANVLDYLVNGNKFPEAWQRHTVYFLGTTYLDSQYIESVLVAKYDDKQWKVRLKATLDGTETNARVVLLLR